MRFSRFLACLALFAALLFSCDHVLAEEPKESARELFTRGVERMKAGRDDDALQLFLRSFELFPTRGNTQNAALMLSKVGRFDEALDMFERLLNDHPDLGEVDRALVQKEISKLARQVARIEISSTETGATVLVDGRERGTIPLSGTLRVVAGSHLISVNKPGALAFSRRVDLRGGELVIIDVRLPRLEKSGVLRVTEGNGKRARVFVDGAPVGFTPWSGSLSVGKHSVLLTGEGELGTQPVSTPVRLNETSVLNLALEPLACRVRIEPVPIAAEIEIDGVVLGRGIWSGRLACREHLLTASESGFVPTKQRFLLRENEIANVRVELERARPKVLPDAWDGLVLPIEATAGPLLALSLADACSGDCSQELPHGFHATLGVDYRLDQRFTLGLELSYLRLEGGVNDRALVVEDGSAGGDLDGRVDDDFRLSGPAAGLRLGIATSGKWSFRFRVALGVWLAHLEWARAGELPSQNERIVRANESFNARYAYFAPEARFGRRLGRRAFVSVGVRPMALIALGTPEWEYDDSPPLATATGSRFVIYPHEPLLEKVVGLLALNLGFEYAFF